MRKYESRTVLVETPQMTNPGMKSLNDTLKGESLVECDPELDYCENFEEPDEPQVIWNFGPIGQEYPNDLPIAEWDLTPVCSETDLTPVGSEADMTPIEYDSDVSYSINVTDYELRAPSELKTDYIRLQIDWM
jgi:hypothetical protein